VADDGGATVTVVFLGGGERMLDTTITELDVVTGKAAMSSVLEVRAVVGYVATPVATERLVWASPRSPSKPDPPSPDSDTIQPRHRTSNSRSPRCRKLTVR
jgi:hypothetical protein